jgi:hypothetical protein
LILIGARHYGMGGDENEERLSKHREVNSYQAAFFAVSAAKSQARIPAGLPVQDHAGCERQSPDGARDSRAVPGDPPGTPRGGWNHACLPGYF